MNVTATLIGQVLTFTVLVWFIMRYLWGPLTQMMQDRQRRIADGLAAAERGKHERELAEKRALEILRKAKADAAEVIALAEKRAAEVAEEAKNQARAEAERILHAARADIDREINSAREQLRTAVSELAVAGAARILEKEIDQKTHAGLVESVVKRL